MDVFGPILLSWGYFWALWGGLARPLGLPGATLGGPGGGFGAPWGAQGGPGEHLGTPLGAFGPAFGLQGSICEFFDFKKHQKLTDLGPFGVDFGTEIGVEC